MFSGSTCVLLLPLYCAAHNTVLPSSMMTSSNRNIFRVTGHFCGEFTGLRWIPRTDQWRGALMFSLICDWIKQLSRQSWGWWFQTLSCPLWRHWQKKTIILHNGQLQTVHTNYHSFDILRNFRHYIGNEVVRNTILTQEIIDAFQSSYKVIQNEYVSERMYRIHVYSLHYHDIIEA